VNYVERNPVRAGRVELPGEYPWSSARAHVLGNPHAVLNPGTFDARIAPGERWGAWVTEADDEQAYVPLRANTYTGWPTGSAEFIAQLECQLGRRLQRQPAGRKPKPGGNT